MNAKMDISVIIPVTERHDPVRELYLEYKENIERTGKKYEIIYVLDGDISSVETSLKSMQHQGESVKYIRLSKKFGESTALTAGFKRASGELIVTLPAYHQVEPTELGKLFDEAERYDMVIGRRWPRTDSRFNRAQTRIFSGILHAFLGKNYRDLGCSVRAFRRAVVEEIRLYGDQHRFFPILAEKQGFRVREIDLQQSPHDAYRRVYGPGVYPRRLLDILAVFFLVKFTKKPLRFFGLIGFGTFAAGGLMLLYLVAERILLNAPLADRPALLLSSLMLVLGVQTFALGLLGGLIIFTHADEVKEYAVDEVVN